MSESMAAQVVETLKKRKERLVLAESCTGGMVAAMISQVPGASEVFCGSFVTYRAQSKQDWLGVNPTVIDNFSTESAECAREMARGACNECIEADWSVSVVGHFGPDAPPDKDGKIWVSIARWINGGREIEEHAVTYSLVNASRTGRQRAAAEYVLTFLAQCLLN